jgi:hypothetical protein
MPRSHAHSMGLATFSPGVLLATALLLALIVAAGLLHPASVAAATITVQSGADAGGTCPGATCTLRQAIATAAAGDTINFSGVTTVTLTTAELLISKNLIIDGGAGGVTVRRAAGSPDFRIFHISGGVTVTLQRLEIVNGRASGVFPASAGGGIFNENSTLNLTNSTVRGSRADAGGGIYNGADGGAASVTLTGSTISNNRSDGLGGGILNNATGFPATLTITNSTLSGNEALSDGGGIYNWARTTNATATLDYVTMMDNIGTDGQHIHTRQGGGPQIATTVYGRSAFGHSNAALTGYFATSSIGPGALTQTSNGYNISQQDLPNAVGTDLTLTNPQLGALANNGGGNQTHMPGVSSPARNSIPNANCGLATDQRGVARPRPAGGACDRGAVEARPGTTLTLAPSPVNGVYGGSVTVTGTLTADEPVAPLAGRTLTFTLNGGGAGSGTTDSNGEVMIAIPLGTTAAGTYTAPAQGIGVAFAGGGGFSASTASATLNIAKADTSTTVDNKTVTYGNASVTLTATIANTSNGAALTGGTVTFSVPGVCSPAPVAIPTGSASVTASAVCPLAGATAGGHTINASYNGDGNFNVSSDTGTLTINKADTSTAIVTPIAVASCGDPTATVGVRVSNDSNNAALTGGTVTVTIKQGLTVIGSATSGAVVGAEPVTVSVAVPLGGALPGSYSVEASYSGDGNFKASTAPPQALTIVKTNTTATVQTASATYGDASVALKATVASANGAALTGGTVTFAVKKGGVTLATVTSGPVVGASPAVATATLALDGTLNAGNYTVEASYSGNACFNPASDDGTLTIKRRLLWIKPADRTVGLHQPNPPTSPQNDPACPAPSRCLELANGSSFAYGQSWSALDLTLLRFQYERNPPHTNATEYVGKTYRITAFGVNAMNYDIRYKPGTMTVGP